MACFLAPAVEAVVVTIIKESIRKREAEQIKLRSHAEMPDDQPLAGISWGQKLSWLANLLWSSIFLLVIEHIWHGEVVPWPPFLTK